MTNREKEQFFTNLSIESGMMVSNDTVMHIYNAIIRLVQKELPIKKEFELPNLGTFKLIPSKKEMVNKFDPKTGTTRMIAGAPAIRFSTDYKLKYYCRNVSN